MLEVIGRGEKTSYSCQQQDQGYFVGHLRSEGRRNGTRWGQCDPEPNFKKAINGHFHKLHLFYILYLASYFSICVCLYAIQDSQGDQPLADETFLSKIKIYLSIYYGEAIGSLWTVWPPWQTTVCSGCFTLELFVFTKISHGSVNLFMLLGLRWALGVHFIT